MRGGGWGGGGGIISVISFWVLSFFSFLDIKHWIKLSFHTKPISFSFAIIKDFFFFFFFLIFDFFFFFFFFLFFFIDLGFRLFHSHIRVKGKVGQKREIPEKNHMATRKQYWACLTCDPS